jgi:hypothetical protein
MAVVAKSPAARLAAKAAAILMACSLCVQKAARVARGRAAPPQARIDAGADDAKRDLEFRGLAKGLKAIKAISGGI